MANYDALGFNAGKLKKIGASDVLESAGGLVVKDGGTIGSASASDAITIAAAGDVTFDQDVVITQNLTVNGTTTTVNSTTVSVADPVFELGDDASDDNLDRGIKMKYNSSGAKIAFMGLDDSDGKFVMIADATDSSSVFSGTVATLKANLEGTVPETSVTAHQGALSITESQISDFGSYLTAEVNDLTASVTWANVPDANITSSSVTQHEGDLSITESQISDLQSYLLEVGYSDFSTGLVDEDLSSVSASHDTIASAKAIKDYVDGEVSASTLTGGDNISISDGAINLDSSVNLGEGSDLSADQVFVNQFLAANVQVVTADLSETIGVGKAVCLASNGTVQLSDNTNSSKDMVVGIVIDDGSPGRTEYTVASDSPSNDGKGVPVAVAGSIVTATITGTQAVGAEVYLSTGGGLHMNPPGSGAIIRVGYCWDTSTNKILIQPQFIMDN